MSTVETFTTPSGLTIRKTGKAYLIKDGRYDRTSAVLDVINKPNILKWYKEKGFEEAERILKEAGILGTKVHAMVEHICRGHDPWPHFTMRGEDGKDVVVQVEGGELEPYYKAYVPWHERHVRQILLVEEVVWSDEWSYAGTLDNFAEMKKCASDACPDVNCKVYAQDNLLALLDVKTSRWLSWTYRLQTAAYQLAALERNLIPDVDLRGIVHLSSRKPGIMRFKPYWEHEIEQRRWLSTLDVYQGQQEHEDDWKD